MKTREYKVKFRINIGSINDKSNNFLKYYLPKWGKFMTVVMSRKLHAVETDQTASVKELPALREIIKDSTKTEDIIELLTLKNPNLARLLIDVSPLFDSSMRDLKAHIVAVFGVKAEELKDYLES